MIYDNQQLNANDLAAIKKTFGEFDKLSAECMDWERTEYKSATDRLYPLLAQIYGVYETKFVNVTDKERLTLRKHLEAKLNISGIQIRKSSDTLGLLIRYIFKTDRRRVMEYKNAIATAKNQKILPAGLAQWLINVGGIDKVNKDKTSSQDKANRKNAKDAAYDSLVKKINDSSVAPLGTINLQCDTSAAEVMMLAKHTGKGQFNIVYVFDDPSDGIKKMLMNKVATKNLKDQAESKALANEAESFARKAPISETKLSIAA